MVAQSIFANRLLQTLEATAPRLNPAQVLGTGASDLHHVFGGGDLTAVLSAYMIGIKDVFASSLAASAFAVLVALIIPSTKLPDPDGKKTETDEKLATA